MKKKALKKTKFSLKKEYGKAFGYLKESQFYIYGSAVFFVLTAVLGYFLASHLGFLDSVIKEAFESTMNLSGISLIGSIFWNNIKVSFLAILLGTLFGIVPFFYNAFNGLLVGYVIKKVTQTSSFVELWRLLPHGILELPAIFISFGIGIRLGLFFLAKDPEKEFKHRMTESLRVFILIVLVLLFFAAIIEGTLITLYK